jgi:Ca2+-binding RTX toxin-like protein
MKWVHSLVTGAAVFLSAASAMAASASVSGATLNYTAGNNETNMVLITLSGSTYTINDSGASISPGSGCSGSGSTVTCTGSITTITVGLGNNGDQLWNMTNTAMNATGGSGNDTMVGGGGVDVLNGEGDNDIIHGRGSSDLLTGEAGTDQLYGGDAADYLNGGTGTDTLSGDGDNDTIEGGGGTGDIVSYATATGGVTVNLNTTGTAQNTGAAGSDTLSNVWGVVGSIHVDVLTSHASGSSLDGGQSADYLYGAAGADELRGGDGNDLLIALGGNDKLWGGAGDDYMEGGAANDELSGEGGQDYLVGDDFDVNTTDGDDTLVDSSGNNVLLGGGGSDNIWAFNSRKDIINCGNNVPDTATTDLLATETAVSGCLTVNQLGTGAAALGNAFCQVKAIVHTVCTQCHRPGGAGPMSLLTWADTQPTSATHAPSKIWQRMVFRVGAPLLFQMPQSRQLSSGEIGAFNTWNTAGGTGSDSCP